MNFLLTYRSVFCLLSFFVLGITLSLSRGHYSAGALCGIILALVIYAGKDGQKYLKPDRTIHPHYTFFLCLVATVFLGFALAFNPNIIYPQSDFLALYFLNITRIVIVLVGIFLLIQFFRPLSEKGILHWFVFLLAALAYLRFFVLSLSPEPFIDVFAVSSIGADYLLSGHNPYTQTYPDLYNGAYHNPLPPCLPYGPIYLLLIVPFRLLHDIRLASIASDALTVAALWRIGTFLKWNILTRSSLILLWLIFPVSLFILEQSWLDPLLVAAVAWSFSFLIENKIRSLGIALGLVCGIKLYGVIAAGLILVHLARTQKWKSAFGAGAIAATLLLAVYLPFIILDTSALIRCTWTSLVSLAPRPDALTLWALLWDQFDFPQPKSGTLAISAVPMGLAFWFYLRSAPNVARLARVMALCFASLFFLGSQAFCNYYYFVAFLIFMELIFSLTPVEAEKSGNVSGPAGT